MDVDSETLDDSPSLYSRFARLATRLVKSLSTMKTATHILVAWWLVADPIFPKPC